MNLSNCSYPQARYVVQAMCSDMGWVDVKPCSTMKEAESARDDLVANDGAWMPGKYKRQTRIVFAK